MKSMATPLAKSAGRSEFVRMDRCTGWWLLGAASVGLLASWQLTVDKLHLLADPAFTPACSLSALVNCRSVMQSSHSTLFGIPNSLIGIAAFACLIAVSLAILARARMQVWYMWGLLAGTVAGVVFIHWLAFQTAFEIGALCLYCVAVWIATLTALGALASACLSHVLPEVPPGKVTSILSFTYEWMPVLVALWISILAIVVTIGLVK